jgi:meiotic recombination protein SPO11
VRIPSSSLLFPRILTRKNRFRSLSVDASDGDLVHLIEAIFLELGRSLTADSDARLSVLSAREIAAFNPEALAWGLRRDHAASLSFRCRALSDPRTATRVARIYRALSLVHGALTSKRAMRKRSVYYADVQLFGSQSASDAALLDCAALLCVPASRLGVHASPRGLVRGALMLNGVDCSECSQLIPAAGEADGGALPAVHVRDDVRFVLVVEKEASFQTLLAADFDRTHSCVLVCGRGYPDVGTRMLVRALANSCSAPQLALVDGDPHGVEILLTYTVGSKNYAADAADCNVRHLRWIGLHVADAEAMRLPQQALLPLTPADRKCGERLLQSAALAQCRGAWREQVVAMLERGTKVELQAIGEQQLASYITQKIEQTTWL